MSAGVPSPLGVTPKRQVVAEVPDAGRTTQCFLPSYLDQSVVKIRPSECQRWNVGVPGIGTTMLIVFTSTSASSRNSTVRRLVLASELSPVLGDRVQHDHHVTVDVQDTGVGIEHELRQRRIEIWIGRNTE